MKIDAIDEKSILVELSKEDLLKNNVTFEQLDYSNEKTRKLVRLVLEKVRLETGRCISDCGSLEVDVMPDSFGGCLMIFKEKAEKREKKEKVSVFFTDEINDVIDLSRNFKKSGSMIEKNELYRIDRTFVLFAFNVSNAQGAVLNEFLEPLFLSEAKLLSLKEAGECLIKGKALQKLSQ